MCDFDNFMLIYQRGEKLSPYKYHMNHNKTVAEAALKTYTAPLLTHLSEATWSSEVEKHLQTQVLPMPIIVAHFAETAPEIAVSFSKDLGRWKMWVGEFFLGVNAAYDSEREDSSRVVHEDARDHAAASVHESM